jgi:hypothetical protein
MPAATVASPSWLVKAIESGQPFVSENDLQQARREHARDPNFPAIAAQGNSDLRASRWKRKVQSPEEMARSKPISQKVWHAALAHQAEQHEMGGHSPTILRSQPKPHRPMTASEVRIHKLHDLLIFLI